MEDVIIRLYIGDDTADAEEIEMALDDLGVDYDYDEGGRLMIGISDLNEVAEVLDEIGADYEVI